MVPVAFAAAAGRMKSEGCVGVCASACTRMWVGVSLLGVWGPLVFVPLTGRSGIYVFTETGAPENFGVLDQLQGPFIVSPRGRIVVSGTVSIRWCSGTRVARSPPRARVRQRRELQKHAIGICRVVRRDEDGYRGCVETATRPRTEPFVLRGDRPKPTRRPCCTVAKYRQPLLCLAISILQPSGTTTLN